MTARNPMKNLFTKNFTKPSELLCCAFGLKGSEIDVYFSLLKGSKTVEEIASDIGRDRSTVQRCLMKLKTKEDEDDMFGLVTQEKHQIERGGYFYRYHAVSTKEVREQILDQLDDWYQSTRRFLLSSWSERPE